MATAAVITRGTMTEQRSRGKPSLIDRYRSMRRERERDGAAAQGSSEEIADEETAELLERFKKAIGQPQRVTMKGLSVVSPEWRQLRADFAAQASLYEDLTLRVIGWLEQPPAMDWRFRQPNHAVILWKFIEGTENELDRPGSSLSTPPESSMEARPEGSPRASQF